MSGRLSMPLSISFFQAPNLPDCNLLYFFDHSGPVMCWSIRLVEPYPFLFYSSGSPISWSNCPCSCYPYVFRQATPTYSFVPSYERCTVGQSNPFGNSKATRYYFFSHLRLLLRLPPKNFFNKGFATSPRIGAAADAISPKGIPLPLCFLIYRLFSPQYTKHLFLQIVFPSF